MSSDHRDYWSDYTLSGLEIEARPYDRKNFPTDPADMPPYFWNASHKAAPATHRGYSEARSLIGRGTVADIENLTTEAIGIINRVFSSTSEHADSLPHLVKLRLSSSLEAWRNTQRELGNILPAKKFGLFKASNKVLDLFKATDWPEAMLMTNALFGSGIGNLLMGAADAPTLFSNYVTDMMAYSEHGYDLVFPSFKALLEKGLSDPYALETLGGYERRASLRFNDNYVQGKAELEKRHKSSLTYRMARLGRRDMHIVLFLDTELIGTVAEAISRGYDAGATMSDIVFSRPQTDVIDVGSDLLNSEVVNSFLISADITDTGMYSRRRIRRGSRPYGQ